MTDAHEKTRVFLSYSRRDAELAGRLARELAQRRFVIDFDRAPADPDAGKGIAAEDEWWLRLQDMIAGADVVVFLVSPDSAASKVCDEEIAYARAAGKRIIAVLVRSIDFATAPPRLAALNVKISFVADFAAAADELALALEQDVTWLREGTRLTLAAKRWAESGENEDLLLRGADVTRGFAWAARRPASAAAPSDAVLRFLDAGRSLDERAQAIAAIEKARYVEMERLMKEFLAEELRLRENSREDLGHKASDQEQRAEIEMIRALLDDTTRWHRQPAALVQQLSATEGYGAVFKFPCCGKQVMDWYGGPSQLRSDGCVDAPTIIQHKPTDRTFYSRVMRDFRELRAVTSGEKPLF